MEIQKIERVERNIQDGDSKSGLNLGGAVASLGTLGKHWGLLLHIVIDDGDGKHHATKLVEAGCGEDGYLQASMREWYEKKKEWKEAAGYKIEAVEMPEGPTSFPLEKLENLIYGINEAKSTYWALWNNCQDFVNLILKVLGSPIAYNKTAKNAFFGSVGASVAVLGACAIASTVNKRQKDQKESGIMEKF